MLFSTHTTLALFAIFVSAAAVPHGCPPGATVTVTTTVYETTTVSVGLPASTAGHASVTPSSQHSATHHTPTPSPSSSPTPTPSPSPPSNGRTKLNLCCNYKGNADSVVMTVLAGLLGIDLSGKTGLVGVACTLIGEGSISSNCNGSLLQCSSLSGLLGLQLGSDCSV